MDILKIKRVLVESSSKINKAESFSDRMMIIYNELDKAFPQTSQAVALYGPITSMVDYMQGAR